MKKLSDKEANACRFLSQFGERGFCPPWTSIGYEEKAVLKVLDSLVKKGRATVEMTDDGPRYTLIAQSEAA